MHPQPSHGGGIVGDRLTPQNHNRANNGSIKHMGSELSQAGEDSSIMVSRVWVVFHDQNRHQQHGYDAVDTAQQQASEGIEGQCGKTQKCGVDEGEADAHGDVKCQAHRKRGVLTRAYQQGSSSLYHIHMGPAQPAGKQQGNRHGHSPSETGREQ